MAVNWFTCPSCSCDLLHHFRIAGKDPWEVLHFTQVSYFFLLQQAFHLAGVKGSACRLKTCSRHAGGRPKIEFEGNCQPVADHKFHPFNTANIRNFMRVADSSYRPM